MTMRFVVVAAAAMLAVPALGAEPVTRLPGAPYRPMAAQKVTNSA